MYICTHTHTQRERERETDTDTDTHTHLSRRIQSRGSGSESGIRRVADTHAVEAGTICENIRRWYFPDELRCAQSVKRDLIHT